ncbi:MAG: VOC family protein [Pseudomonadota bacterium]
MIGYVMVGTNDLARACAFYDELMSALGYARVMEEEAFVAWGESLMEPCLSVTLPFDGEPASVGNGSMIALRAASQDEVDSSYAKALELGATDEGAPGLRGEGFYAAYFRDLDGNKLNLCFMG